MPISKYTSKQFGMKYRSDMGASKVCWPVRQSCLVIGGVSPISTNENPVRVVAWRIELVL